MNKFRYDGTFVITLNGLSYHVTKEDTLYNQTSADYTNNPDNYEAEETDTMKYQNGQWIDISDTDDYKAKILEQENNIKKNQLQALLDELDKKRIRAVCEPSLKDATEGETWLEYYTGQIHDLRNQLAGL